MISTRERVEGEEKSTGADWRGEWRLADSDEEDEDEADEDVSTINKLCD